ncbi:MAG: MATE family efflux transporter [Thermomicrobiales bacterium]
MVSTVEVPLIDEELGAEIQEAFAPQPRPLMTQRRVLALALPIIGENLLQTMVGAVDTLMVSQLGKEAVAGVGTSIEFVFFIISILSAVSIGATVLVSQAFGAGDHKRTHELARQAIVWGVLLAIPVSLLGLLFAGDLISVFGTEPGVARNATTYLEIIAATSIVLLLDFVCGSVFRGVGDSRTPLKAAMVANVINVIAAYLLIFGHLGLPELGVAGSAWGAAIGRGTAAAIMLTLLVRGKRSVSIRGRAGWRPHLEIGRSLLRLGLPAALEQMLMSCGFMTMVAVVALLGTVSLAAQQIGFSALSIAFIPGFGFAIAATALVGQSIGARDVAGAKKATRIAMIGGTLWMGTGALIYFIFARQIMDIFSNDPQVINAGVGALRALSISLPFWAAWSVNGGALRGSGDTRSPMYASVSAVWIAVGLAYLGVRAFDFGLAWCWLTFAITSPLAALWNRTRFMRRLSPEFGLLDKPFDAAAVEITH